MVDNIYLPSPIEIHFDLIKDVLGHDWRMFQEKIVENKRGTKILIKPFKNSKHRPSGIAIEFHR